MQGLTPEEQEEYDILLKKGNKILKIILAIAFVIIVLAVLSKKRII